MGNFLELLKMAKNQRFLALTLFILVIGTLIKSISNFKKFSSLDKILNLILLNWYNLLYVVILAFIFIYLLKTSHKKSEDFLNDYYNKEEILDVAVNKLLTGTIKISRNLRFDDEIIVSVKNISDERISYINGFISIYKNKIRIKKLPINIKMLDIGYSEVIYQSVDDFKLFNFDEFDIYIEEVKTKSETLREIYEPGPLFVRTYSLILNREKYIDYRLFGIKTKYNLVWIKQKFEEVMSRIKFLYKKKRYGNQNLLRELSSLIGRSILFIFIYSIILVMILATIFFIAKTFILLWQLVPLLYEILVKG